MDPKLLKKKLSNFEELLKNLKMNLFFFLPKKYQNSLTTGKYKKIFLMALNNQLKVITNNGKY